MNEANVWPVCTNYDYICLMYPQTIQNHQVGSALLQVN